MQEALAATEMPCFTSPYIEDNSPPPMSAAGLSLWHSIFETVCAPFAAFSGAASEVLRVVSKTSAVKSMPGADVATRVVAAWLKTGNMLTKHYPEPPYRVDAIEIDGMSLPFARLRHFIPDGGARGEPVLIVPAMANNYPSMMREVVRSLLQQEHDVYVAHWIGAERVPLSQGNFSLDTYVEYLLTFLSHIGDRANIVAVCQAGPASLAATALTYQLGDLYPRPQTLTIIASPMDVRANPCDMNIEARKRSVAWVEKHCLDTVPFFDPGGGRQAYSGIGQRLGLLKSGAAVHKYRGQKLFDAIVDGNDAEAEALRAFYEDNFNPRMATDGPFALQTFQTVFKEQLLPRGLWMWNGIAIDPSSITDTAALAIEGSKDDLCPLGQTRAFCDWAPHLPASKIGHKVYDAGHYSVFAGDAWKTQGSRDVSDFIRSNTTKKFFTQSCVQDLKVA